MLHALPLCAEGTLQTAFQVRRALLLLLRLLECRAIACINNTIWSYKTWLLCIVHDGIGTDWIDAVCKACLQSHKSSTVAVDLNP